jgi:hypothetical protein
MLDSGRRRKGRRGDVIGESAWTRWASMKRPVLAVPSIEEYLVAWARVFRRDDESDFSAAGEGVTVPGGVLEMQTVGLSFTLADLDGGIV